MALIGPGGMPVTSKPAQNAAAAGAPSPHIKDSGLATFAADVLEASREMPVIVDFWAPWCEPCKSLGPALEKAVNEAERRGQAGQGQYRRNPEIAQQLRIQSIPTVYAFKDGQPVDGFMGAIPESQVKAFVAQLAGGEAGHGHDHGGPEHAAEVLAIADDAFAAGDIGTAAQAYGHVLQDEPGNPSAVAGLAACYLKSGDLERARTTLQLVRPDGAQDEAIRAVEAELKLREKAPPPSESRRSRTSLPPMPTTIRPATTWPWRWMPAATATAPSPNCWRSCAATANGMRTRRASICVTLFEAMGFADPRTVEARRKLSSLLFS